MNADLDNGGSANTSGTAASPRWTQHPAFALVLRALAVALLMGGLAAIGVMSTLGQVPFRSPPPVVAAHLTSAWLALPQAAPSGSATQPLVPNQPAAAPSGRKGSESTSAGVTSDGKVVLNNASVEELTRLPGIGVKRAAAIVALRQRLGRFRRPTDLLRVKGIGPKSLAKMRPHFVLDAPASSDPPDS